MSGQRMPKEELRALIRVICPECCRALPVDFFRQAKRTGSMRQDRCGECKDGRGSMTKEGAA